MESTQPHGVLIEIQGMYLFILYLYQFSRRVNIHRDNFSQILGQAVCIDTHTHLSQDFIFSPIFA